MRTIDIILALPLVACALRAFPADGAGAERHETTALPASGAIGRAHASLQGLPVDTAAIRKRLRYPEKERRSGARGFAFAAVTADAGRGLHVIGMEATNPAFERALRDALRGMRREPSPDPMWRDTLEVRVLFLSELIHDARGAYRTDVGITIENRIGLAEIPPRVTVDGRGPANEITLRSPSESGAIGAPPMEERSTVLGGSGSPVRIAVDIETPDSRAKGGDAGDDPDPYEFIALDTMPEYDAAELVRRLIYPEDARRNGIEGMVILRVLVGKDGDVKKTMIEKGDPLFDAAAVKAVKALKFNPAMRDKRAVAAWIMLPIRFSLSN